MTTPLFEAPAQGSACGAHGARGNQGQVVWCQAVCHSYPPEWAWLDGGLGDLTMRPIGGGVPGSRLWRARSSAALRATAVNRACGLGQRTSSRERVADERVPSVMDGQGSDGFRAEHPTCRQEPSADGVALKRLAATVGLHRARKQIGAASLLPPRARPSMPSGQPAYPRPTRGEPAATCRPSCPTQTKMRSGDAHDDVLEP